MPRAAAKPLTVKGVEAKAEAGLYALGGNLYLKVLSLSCCRFRGHEDKIVTKKLESGYDETEVQP